MLITNKQTSYEYENKSNYGEKYILVDISIYDKRFYLCLAMNSSKIVDK